jgi:hypothetical protein
MSKGNLVNFFLRINFNGNWEYKFFIGIFIANLFDGIDGACGFSFIIWVKGCFHLFSGGLFFDR